MRHALILGLGGLLLAGASLAQDVEAGRKVATMCRTCHGLDGIAAIPVARYVEYLTPSAYIDEIVAEPFRLDDQGFLAIPQRPGLGIDLDPDKLKRFCPDPIVFR